MKTEDVIIANLKCNGCASTIKKELSSLNGVKEVAVDVTVVRINADDNAELCKALQIDALPTIKFYKNKALTWTNVGFIDKAGILTQIQ